MNIQKTSSLLAICMFSLADTLHAEMPSVVFNARIDAVELTRRFDQKTIVTGADPRFVVRLTLKDDVKGVGSAGEKVAFAIHSPARDLRISAQEYAIGKQIRLKFSRSKDTNFKFLARAETKNQQSAPIDGDKPPK